mmetsp:Transcript_16689/g.34582  ORF Transcript_16689/g.34582 Transcript_16689/m.34582 type:complete len:363 (-) Transcript_16689:145-1233(-)
MADSLHVLAGTLGKLWKKSRRSLPPAVRHSYAELLLAIRHEVLPQAHLDSAANLGRARSDVRGITELFAYLANGAVKSSGLCRLPDIVPPIVLPTVPFTSAMRHDAPCFVPAPSWSSAETLVYSYGVFVPPARISIPAKKVRFDLSSSAEHEATVATDSPPDTLIPMPLSSASWPDSCTSSTSSSSTPAPPSVLHQALLSGHFGTIKRRITVKQPPVPSMPRSLPLPIQAVIASSVRDLVVHLHPNKQSPVVTIDVDLPNGCTPADCHIVFLRSRLEVSVCGVLRLAGDLFGTIFDDKSTFTVDGLLLRIVLHKRVRKIHWDRIFECKSFMLPSKYSFGPDDCPIDISLLPAWLFDDDLKDT